MKAWHFTAGDRLRDGRPVPPVGEWLEHAGAVVPCSSGLHASRRLIDALSYAPGGMLHRVEIGGTMLPHGDDKHAASRRRALWSLDATAVLLRFARREALDVAHLWDAPEIVLRYLRTGDASIRTAAYAAAHAAAWDAARSAALDAAGDAALDAARATALGVARTAALGVARAAAWDAARATALGVARAAAWDAARSAALDAARTAALGVARAAAWTAAGDAAWAVARGRQNRRITSMVMAERVRLIGGAR
jgi:hypothetical protein